MNISQIEARQRANDAFGNDLKGRIKAVETKGFNSANAKALSDDYSAWQAEQDLLKNERERHQRSEAIMAKMRGGADAGRGADADIKDAGKFYAPSPLTVPAEAYKGLFEASKKRLPSYRVELDGKDFASEAIVKSPFGETSFTSGGLPPILMPGLTQELPYEPDRLFSHFIQQAAPAASSVEWIQHTGNANPAAPVSELGVKPDLGMQLTTHTTSFTKIAALASMSDEALQDFETFLTFVPMELQRAIIDAETDQIVNGNGTPPNMTGLANLSGTLTRAIGSDTPIDCLRKAFNDLRVGSSFATANLVAMHPTTWADLQLQKSTQGVYLLNPNDPNALGDLNNIFGVRVITNTHIAAGTALVFDTTKAVLAWTRQGMRLDINGYGTNEFTQNYVTFRAECRIAIGVQRPTAINIVTGLPT